jgi:hypothetical protein
MDTSVAVGRQLGDDRHARLERLLDDPNLLRRDPTPTVLSAEPM